jgi:spermidine synthase
MGQHFTDQSFYSAAVPTYYGGIMTFAWGSDDAALREAPLDTLRQRFADSGIQTRYYTPEIHQASFALPAYVQDELASA